jgi:hypothetical protein
MTTDNDDAVDVLIGLAMVPVVVIFSGYVLMKLWAWHVVPVFDLPRLSWGHAIGLDLVALIFRGVNSKKDDSNPSAPAATRGFAVCTLFAIILLIGWLAR